MMKWSDLTTTFKLIVSGLLIVALLAVLSMGYNFYADRFKPPASQSNYINQPEIPKAQKIEHKKIVVLSKIDVLDKEKAVEKLKINDPVKSDKAKQITATAEIPPYDGKTNVISVLDTEKGTSEIIAKQEPLSFFGFENKKRIGFDIGYCLKNQDVCGDVFAEWDFARVAKGHIGLYGEVSDNSKAMVRFYYEF